jgi:hypothetical protein
MHDMFLIGFCPEMTKLSSSKGKARRVALRQGEPIGKAFARGVVKGKGHVGSGVRGALKAIASRIHVVD